MILNKQQEEGLKIAVDRYRKKEPYTCISGYAGSGKSTLIKFIIDALNIDPDLVGYCAFTGKAANVLKQKGCKNATTAHKLLYYSKSLPNGKFIFTKRKRLENDYSIIVVDEVSMLPKELWELLLTHKIYVLACGDPEQLPPIDKDADNHVLDNPHIFLDEIMRQAQESEIIRLSMHIRNNMGLETFSSSEEQVMIVNKNEVVEGMYTWADQILCAKNATRNNINNIVRKLNKYPKKPCLNDKVIGLQNHWNFLSSEGAPLTNGSMGKMTYIKRDKLYIPKYIKEEPLDVLLTNIETEDGETFYDVVIDYKSITEGIKQLTSKEEYLLNKREDLPPAPFEFNYGYAITTWKAQGSEWDKILLFEENFPFDKIEKRKFLYTGITRAKEKVVIVKS